MAKSIFEHVIGSFDEKRIWRSMMKRVNALPQDYRFAFKQILHYFYNFSFDMEMLTDLVELFEASSAQSRPVLEIVGSDVAAFCDELIRASSANTVTVRDKLNREILEHFHREVK